MAPICGSCIRSYLTFFFYQNLLTQCNAYPLLDLDKNQYIRFIDGTNKNTIECKILEIVSICRRRMFVEKNVLLLHYTVSVYGTDVDIQWNVRNIHLTHNTKVVCVRLHFFLPRYALTALLKYKKQRKKEKRGKVVNAKKKNKQNNQNSNSNRIFFF